MRQTLERASGPLVHRRWLLLTAAVVWAAVGIMLTVRAAGMASGSPPVVAVPVFHAAALFALAMFAMVFRPLAGRNSDRIEAGEMRRSVLGFQTRRGYAITVAMILLGVALRHAGLPAAVLTVLYAGVGIGLVVGGAVYFIRFLRHP